MDIEDIFIEKLADIWLEISSLGLMANSIDTELTRIRELLEKLDSEPAEDDS